MKSTITLQVPIEFKRKSARRLVIAPDNAADQSLSFNHQIDPTMVKALIRAYRWQQLIDSGKALHAEDLGEKEGVTGSYITRILRLNTLCPDIRRAILDGCHPKTLCLIDIMKPFPMLWDDQMRYFGF